MYLSSNDVRITPCFEYLAFFLFLFLFLHEGYFKKKSAHRNNINRACLTITGSVMLLGDKHVQSELFTEKPVQKYIHFVSKSLFHKFFNKTMVVTKLTLDGFGCTVKTLFGFMPMFGWYFWLSEL